MKEIQRIGIVCDGQLGRMMVEDGLRMNPDLEFYTLGEGGPNSPAAQVGAHQIDGSIKDPEAIRRLVEMVDVTTWEIEHIDAHALAKLEEEGHNIQSSPRSLAIIQDKLAQKAHLKKHHIDVAPFANLEDDEDFADVRFLFGESFIAKARRGGYDGRSNMKVTPDMTWSDVEKRFGGDTGYTNVYAEKIIPFQRELSVVGIRNMAGRVALYPVVETVHNGNHVCIQTYAPAAIDSHVRTAAEELGRETIRTFDGAGVFAVEMFQDEDDNVLVNEVAPRIHNSAHWTDIGASTSQFEQHVRAISGMPLGSTDAIYPAAVMYNVLATASRKYLPQMESTQPGLNGHIRWYGKAPKADGTERKIGHVTAVGNDMEEAIRYAQALHARATSL